MPVATRTKESDDEGTSDGAVCKHGSQRELASSTKRVLEGGTIAPAPYSE
jgi:hypothetical protein